MPIENTLYTVSWIFPIQTNGMAIQLTAYREELMLHLRFAQILAHTQLVALCYHVIIKGPSFEAPKLLLIVKHEDPKFMQASFG